MNITLPAFLRAFIIYLYFSLWCCSGALFFIVAGVLSANNAFFSFKGFVQFNLADILLPLFRNFLAEIWQTS